MAAPHHHSDPISAPSPLAWGVAHRLAVAAGLSGLLWLAVAWALGWGG